MQWGTPRKAQIMIRPDAELHEQVLEAGRRHGSMNRWIIGAIRDRLKRESQGRAGALIRETHHEDPRDEFEWEWAHALVRRLRDPGKARPILDHLADLWKLPWPGKRK